MDFIIIEVVIGKIKFSLIGLVDQSMKCLIVGGNDSEIRSEQTELFQNECIRIGQFLSNAGHSLIVCSPFQDSADYWVLKGFSNGNLDQVIEFHFLDNTTVRAELEKIEGELNLKGIIKIPHPKPNSNDSKSIGYSWLFCQLEALETCHFIIAIGGKLDGSANMLLLLAESKRKLIIPLCFLGGAASQSFFRRRYELEDKLGTDYLLLQEGCEIFTSTKLDGVLSGCKMSIDFERKDELSFFISYPRAKPAEADYIETLLRRRNINVFRDESDFGAGSSIPTDITEAIHSANIFMLYGVLNMLVVLGVLMNLN